MAFDLITMAATIGKLESSGQIGSGEAGKTYAWDGDQENKVYVPYINDGGFVKVSDDMPDLRKFEKIITVNGTLLPSDNSHYFVEGTAENGELFGAKGHALCDASAPLAVVITDTLNSPIPSTGLYFLCADILNGDIAELTKELVMPSTIKTIDPKYIPGTGNSGGGALPVIDLVALGVKSLKLDDNAYETFTVSPDVRAELISKFAPLTPVVVRLLVDDGPMEAVFTPFAWTPYPDEEEDYICYIACAHHCIVGTPITYMISLDSVNDNVSVEGKVIMY